VFSWKAAEGEVVAGCLVSGGRAFLKGMGLSVHNLFKNFINYVKKGCLWLVSRIELCNSGIKGLQKI
jgi:hypothetical protein